MTAENIGALIDKRMLRSGWRMEKGLYADKELPLVVEILPIEQKIGTLVVKYRMSYQPGTSSLDRKVWLKLNGNSMSAKGEISFPLDAERETVLTKLAILISQINTKRKRFAQAKARAESGFDSSREKMPQQPSLGPLKIGLAAALVTAITMLSFKFLKIIIPWIKRRSRPAAAHMVKAFKATKAGRKAEAKKHVVEALKILKERDAAKLKILLEKVK